MYKQKYEKYKQKYLKLRQFMGGYLIIIDQNFYENLKKVYDVPGVPGVSDDLRDLSDFEDIPVINFQKEGLTNMIDETQQTKRFYIQQANCSHPKQAAGLMVTLLKKFYIEDVLKREGIFRKYIITNTDKLKKHIDNRIEQLIKDLKKLKLPDLKLPELNEELSTFKKKTIQLNEEITALNEEINALNEEITTLNEEITTLKLKKETIQSKENTIQLKEKTIQLIKDTITLKKKPINLKEELTKLEELVLNYNELFNDLSNMNIAVTTGNKTTYFNTDLNYNYIDTILSLTENGENMFVQYLTSGTCYDDFSSYISKPGTITKCNNQTNENTVLINFNSQYLPGNVPDENKLSEIQKRALLHAKNQNYIPSINTDSTFGIETQELRLIWFKECLINFYRECIKNINENIEIVIPLLFGCGLAGGDFREYLKIMATFVFYCRKKHNNVSFKFYKMDTDREVKFKKEIILTFPKPNEDGNLTYRGIINALYGENTSN